MFVKNLINGVFGVLVLVSTLLCSNVQQSRADDVTLTWNASPGQNIASYRVYYSLKKFEPPEDIIGYVQCPASRLSLTVSGLTKKIKYYFVATAIDEEGNESDYSNEVDLIIPDVPPNGGDTNSTIDPPIITPPQPPTPPVIEDTPPPIITLPGQYNRAVNAPPRLVPLANEIQIVSRGGVVTVVEYSGDGRNWHVLKYISHNLNLAEERFTIKVDPLGKYEKMRFYRVYTKDSE